MKRPRLQDVAKLAGVSTPTASQALNGKGRVNAETQDRIAAAAARLGYRANASAVTLRTGRSNLLAIQIGRRERKGILVPSATYFNEILNGVSTEAFRRGWTPVFLPKDTTVEDIRKLNPACGVVIDPQGNESLLRVLVGERRPVLTTGRVVGQRRDTTVLSIDNDVGAAVADALDHLASAGYLRPSLLVSRSTASYTVDAISASREWGRRRGTNVPVVEVKHAMPDDAERVVRTLVAGSARPDAIYAVDEGCALGALRAARQVGLDVPDDLGIVCGLDGPMLSEAWPPITAVDLNPGTVGRGAARRLIEYIETGIRPSDDMVVPFLIRPRRSTQRQQGSR